MPAIDGNIGPCSVEFTVTDASNAPVYNARIRVHIAYRFLSAHKLDLEVGTNVDGKARVNGLPEKVKEALHFKASQADRSGESFYNPAEGCTAKRAIVLKAEDKSGAALAAGPALASTRNLQPLHPTTCGRLAPEGVLAGHDR